MDNEILLHGTTTEQLTKNILQGVKQEFTDLKKHFQPLEPDDWMTRKETAQLLKISLVCLHDWTNKKILKVYKAGNRSYYSRKEVNEMLYNSNK